MRVVLVLLTYNPDEPAGIERSVASLAEGLRTLGHPTCIVAAGPSTAADGSDLLRLTSLTLPRPAVEEDLPKLIADPAPVEQEVRQLLTDRAVELVCWVDAVWGLGYLAPAPASVQTALMVHVLRTDRPMHRESSSPPGHGAYRLRFHGRRSLRRRPGRQRVVGGAQRSAAADSRSPGRDA
ncbi:hypothetical protein [Streptomyces tubercidicus]|uniref:hypothetical protein n=1 Tax=Streptomyces tubercidicus TaxID=47759 RepID=UPI0034651B50